MSKNKLPAKINDKIEELSIEVAVTDTGVKGAVLSRAIVAFDRLVGNLIDLSSAYLEAIIMRKDARTAVEVALIEREGSVALKKLDANSELGDRVVDRFLQKEERRQANQQAVAKEALKELKLLPPPSVTPEDDKTLDDDWLSMFSSHAENATSDRLRKM